jgi:mono/diheme cytochrome c family protein
MGARNAARLSLVLPLLVALPIVAPATPGAQTTGRQNPPLTIPSLAGRDLFEFYCATCHGRDGKGHGPVAPALAAPPSDLTTLARRHGGVFPRARVEGFMRHDGDAPPQAAHGSQEMPIWGPIFRGLDASDTRVRVRIGNVIAYLESIQERGR